MQNDKTLELQKWLCYVFVMYLYVHLIGCKISTVKNVWKLQLYIKNDE